MPTDAVAMSWAVSRRDRASSLGAFRIAASHSTYITSQTLIFLDAVSHGCNAQQCNEPCALYLVPLSDLVVWGPDMCGRTGSHRALLQEA